MTGGTSYICACVCVCVCVCEQEKNGPSVVLVKRHKITDLHKR
jgi:hypothetical protein